MVTSSKAFIVLLVFSMIFQGSVAGLRLKFTKIFCNATDPTFARVDWCIVKPVSRYVQYFKCRFTPLHLPLTQFSLRVQVMKRLNGWKPFLYYVTVGCNFTRHLNVVTRLAWNVISNVSNVKHDCPYDQVIEAERVENVFIENILKRLPIPSGTYGIFATFMSRKVPRVTANFHFDVL